MGQSNCDFDNAVEAVFEEVVGFVNATEGITVGDERCGVDFAGFYQSEYFGTVASVYASCRMATVLS